MPWHRPSHEGICCCFLPVSPTVLILLLSVYFANRLANGGDIGQKQRLSAWVAGGFIGALYGGALKGFQAALEFSRFEQGTAFFAYSTGVMAGLLVIFFLCVEFRQLLCMIPGLSRFYHREDPSLKPVAGEKSGPGNGANERRILGTLTGIVALGLLLYKLSAFSLLPTLVPTAPPVFFVMAVILGIYAGRAEINSLLRRSGGRSAAGGRTGDRGTGLSPAL